MRHHFHFLLLSISVILTSIAMAEATQYLTQEQLRAGAERAERQSQQRSERVDSSNPGAGMPTNTIPEEKTPSIPQVNKYGAASDSSADTTAAPLSNRHAPARRTTTEPQYTPSTSSSGSVKLDVVSVKRHRYGVRIGTVLYGELRRNISSAETGLAEIFLTRDAVGDYRTLPAGSQLFARKRANPATKRMELSCERGITTDGDEFEVNCQVYDDQDVAGVSGIVEEKTVEIVKSGVNKGLLAAGRGVLQSFGTNGSAIGTAASQGGSAVLSDVGRHQEAEADTGIIIYSYPQPVKIRIQNTF
jgi:hypothetical protein